MYIRVFTGVTLALLFSKHAREQMVVRGISEAEIEEAIARGSKALQNPGKLLYYYRYFCVVARKIKDDHFIITVKPR
ncbi:DUF4258 domain-containing protein [Candidatus Woesearchaeota archaeon]|nr:DUF4258 domain-containing protein [Candidatus Woesearchaeota archaeon]